MSALPSSPPVPVRRRSPLAGNLLLAAISLMLCAGLIEGAARLVVRARERRPHTTRGSFVRYHPLLGWDKPPGASGWIHRPEYSVFLEVNAKGLRGPDRPYEKPAGVFRTLLLGDSFTEAYTVAEEKSVRAVLEAELQRAGLKAEVINGGTMGYSTDQELLFHRLEGHRYQADLAVVLFCSNDVYFNTTGEQGKPWFVLEDGRLVLKGSPVFPKKGHWKRGPEPRPIEITSWRGSMALRLLSDRTSQGAPRLHRALARLGLVEGGGRVRVEPIPMELTPLGTIHHAEVKTMWAVTEALLRQLKTEVEAGGGRLALLYIPDRFQVSERDWELTRQQYDLGKRFDPHRMQERVKRICADAGIPFVDPLPALQATQAARSGYFLQDGHWNEDGHEIAARTLADFVRQAAPVH